MEREEKKKQQEEEELLVVKLKQGVFVGKRGGTGTTPSPTWKIGLAQSDGSLLQDFPFSSNSASLSVRKVGANLWEFQPQVRKVVKMSKIGPLPQNHKDKSKLHSQTAAPPDSPPQQINEELSKGKSAIGKPLYTDSFTASMTQISYARVLVEADAQFSSKLSMIGDQNFAECMKFGHKAEACWNAEMAVHEEPKFQEVKNKRRRRNRKAKGVIQQDMPITSRVVVDKRRMDAPANITNSTQSIEGLQTEAQVKVVNSYAALPEEEVTQNGDPRGTLIP
ncbi:hypothetical protein H5410_032343 [Solanum commersonii]|uniref:Uncharacterized protein n=1 Tax=Solanum commersonii TaxID=4109 RepID=A0A9J5YLX5_SOLCO|nr:hypothetical protein H5410_032343 [Solanum commersonii]